MIIKIQNYLDKRLSDKLIKRLNSIPKTEWKRIEHSFNGWDFTCDFYDLKPKWWDSISKRFSQRRHAVIGELCSLINSEFGERKMLEYHNVTVGEMTLDEFNKWYDVMLIRRKL
jgi:hypothetical protein